MLSKQFMARKSAFFRKGLTLSSVCMVPLGASLVMLQSSALMAQAGPVTGFNLTRVEIPGDNGTEVITKMPNGIWAQLGGRGELRTTFVETGRDATSVYLYDKSRDFRIQLDLSDRTLSFRKPDGQKAIFAWMTAFYAAPASASPSQVFTPNNAQSAPQNNVAADSADFDALAEPENPFADPNDPPVVRQQPQQQGQQQVQQNNNSTNSPFGRGGQNNNQNTAGQNNQQTGQQTGWRPPNAGGTQTPNTTAGQYSGPWVSTDTEYRATGDGLKEPMTWALAEVIVVSSPNENTLNISYDNPTTARFPISVQKVGPNSYTGSNHTVRITPIVGSNNFQMVISGPGKTETFRMAATSDGTLSRNRFDDPNGEDRKSGWTPTTFAAGYDYMRYSYRGEKMNLFDARSGRAKPIFALPGSFDYTLAQFLSKNLPFGLVGEKLQNSTVRQFETMISNAATFQKSTSYNFGGGGGAKGASLGIEYSAGQTAGRSSSSETMRAQAMGRVEQYALIQDKPNQKLDPFFESDIRKLVAKQMTAAEFIAFYGTHYAGAIHYGGIAEANREMTTAQLKSHTEKNFSVSGEGSIKGASLKGGYSEVEGSSETSGSMFSKSNFKSVGGDGGLETTSWTVNETNSVPVRYDLRPLSDLISPIFFPKEHSDTSSWSAFYNARARLEIEIGNYMARFPQLENRNIGPRLYQVKFHSIVCVSNNDEGGGPAEIYGKISAIVNHADGHEVLTLLDAPDGAPISIPCRGGEHQLNVAPTIVAGARGATMNDRSKPDGGSKAAALIIATAGLYEDNPTAFVVDDPLDDPNQWIEFEGKNGDNPRSDLSGLTIAHARGLNEGPVLSVKVSFKEIQ